MTAVPTSLDEVTTTWLSAALAPRHGPVESLSLERIGADTGFASVVARVRPTYRRPAAGPASLVVKLAGGTREAAFYRAVGDYAGAPVPHAFWAGADEDTSRSALVLEDLGDARFGDDLHGVSVADAEAGVDALAALHARWWDSPRLAGFGWLPPVGRTLEQRLAEFAGRMEAYLRRYGDLVPDEVRAWSAQIGPGHEALFRRLDDPPPTLLHVDVHVDNVAFRDGEAVLFDWQGASSGPGALDVAHFVASALRGADREARPALLARYHAGLAAGGVAGYPLARLEEDVRLATLRLWVSVVGGGGSPAAAGWTGRAAALARAAAPRWAALAQALRVDELL